MDMKLFADGVQLEPDGTTWVPDAEDKQKIHKVTNTLGRQLTAARRSAGRELREDPPQTLTRDAARGNTRRIQRRTRSKATLELQPPRGEIWHRRSERLAIVTSGVLRSTARLRDCATARMLDCSTSRLSACSRASASEGATTFAYRQLIAEGYLRLATELRRTNPNNVWFMHACLEHAGRGAREFEPAKRRNPTNAQIDSA
eukprot:1191759-Prorocentrum_minimum.AAC.4